jgi:chemotaxis protein methyltransferase CheR
MTPIAVELSARQFQKASRLVYRVCGIYFKPDKKALVQARLMKRLRAVGINNVEEYLDFIECENGSRELGFLIDVMTTNKTGFFRESAHFNFLRDKILPEQKNLRMRFWSAACSSGEEPYSLAITLRNHLAEIDSKDCLILATDISTHMLEKARRAVYSQAALCDLPKALVQKNFVKIDDNSSIIYQVKDNIRCMVRFAWLNLMDSWPMKGPFNVILCRNVMIYFDRATRQKLINRFWDLLEPGGYLFVGHSESLSTISHKFRYVQPATYRK